MRRVILGFLFFFMAPGVASTQSSDEHRSRGYVFFAPGASAPGGTGTLHFGGGSEGLIYKGLGVGGELGYHAPWRSFGDGLGVFSLNGSYHFLPRKNEGKVVPFLTSGYTLFFRSDSLNLFNVGGRVDYWCRERVGQRFEFRDHVHPESSCGRGAAHFLGFHILWAFR